MPGNTSLAVSAPASWADTTVPQDFRMFSSVRLQVTGISGTWTPTMSLTASGTYASVSIYDYQGAAAASITTNGIYVLPGGGWLKLTGGSGGTFVVSAYSTSLTTGGGGGGDATAARQDTGNASLASAVTALQIMDDWDETNRAAVNTIAGQVGVAAGAGSVSALVQRVTLASDDPLVARVPAALGAGGGLKTDPAPSDYEKVAASQTDQVMGTGAAGDRLDAILVIPANLNPGEISIEDGATNTIIFAGGTGSVGSLIPFLIPLGTQGIVSVSGGWEVTTGANVSVIGFGQFT